MAMQKKFGQNFMVNGASRRRLVDALELSTDSRVWEVGPGLGAMTSDILARSSWLTAFEIDRGFCAVLRDIFSDEAKFSLIEGDVLKSWPAELAKSAPPDRFFGNLPYNIAAAIIGDMIAAGVRFDVMVVTVQKEVALRMAAKPNTEDYSSFSVLCQWAYTVESLMDLAPGSFWPRPNVTSRAVRLRKRADWPRCASSATFMILLRALFSSRRKTVKNNLSAWLTQTSRAVAGSADDLAQRVLRDAGIDPGVRAETLVVDDFIRLSDTVEAL
jgi:16S rRNA (adenine1518-N6/adenine1519-N6)-dimethyltransferase